MNCRICGNKNNNRWYTIKEMMFGFNEFFEYYECSECGCLQIGKIPENMSKYYTKYYSFNSEEHSKQNKLIEKLRKLRNKYAFTGDGVFGLLLNEFFPTNNIDSIKKSDINMDSRILDVGCGDGELLKLLKDVGYNNLFGIDPYIKKNIEYNNKVIIKKMTLNELSDDEKFDLIIFNHSFEHIFDQLEILDKITKILSENGICLIRMPIKTEYIWNRYSVNWVQIDAPRHFLIHTIKSFNLLLKKSGLVIKDVLFDSTEFQFLGSEQYKTGVPLMCEDSYVMNPIKNISNMWKAKKFRKIAAKLNLKQQGDQAAFYLRRGSK